MSRNVGLWVASLALLVNTPRLILAYLAADDVALAGGWRAAMLTVSAVATGIVLTGGNAYLAHAVARWRRPSLVTIWCLGLVFTAILVTPMLVASLGKQIAQVIPSLAWRWCWSAVAVLSVELVAAGAMLAVGTAENAEREAGSSEVSPELARAPELSGRRSDQLIELDLSSAVHLPERFSSEVGEVRCRNGCGWTGSSLPAERGHQGQCPLKSAPAL
jgi:hypothetical protein